jgi:signal transduction histidine kinase
VKPSESVDLLVRLAAGTNRMDAARALARRLQVEDLIVLVRDQEVDALIPAPGFPPTLPGGSAWRSFVRACSIPGRHRAQADLPAGPLRPAVAVAAEDIAVIMLGGKPPEEELASLERFMPLLAFAFGAEQRAGIATAASSEAKHAARRIQALADGLEAARAEASKLNAELREEHRRKDDFLAMLAHELRNPLTPLVTSLEMIRLGNQDADAVRRHAGVMARQVRQLTHLVGDLLDVSRVSRGLIELRPEPLSLSDVIREAAEATRPLCDARGHGLEIGLPERAVYVNGDRVRLTQVFSNLLHNAAKYTEPGGRIVLSVERRDADAVVTISDNGIGIAPEVLPHIFELFMQAPVSIARAQGGLGIGLTLVYRLVALHGGRVQVESRGIGWGSTFTVCLPVCETPARSAERDAPAKARPSPGNGAVRVLIVDDNEDAANVLAEIVSILGHHSQVAYSGLRALQMAADAEPDVVFLDIGLPGIDGYEVARRMRRTLPRHTRIVALTGYGGDDYSRRVREAGFDEHLVKPATMEAIEAVTSRVAAAQQ